MSRRAHSTSPYPQVFFFVRAGRVCTRDSKVDIDTAPKMADEKKNHELGTLKIGNYQREIILQPTYSPGKCSAEQNRVRLQKGNESCLAKVNDVTAREENMKRFNLPLK